MSAPLKSIEGTGDMAQSMAKAMGEIGRNARAAARVLALASTAQKDRALELMAAAVPAVRARTATDRPKSTNPNRRGGLGHWPSG